MMWFALVPIASRAPLTVSERPQSNSMTAPRSMVSTTPVATVTLPVIRWTWSALQVVWALIVPECDTTADAGAAQSSARKNSVPAILIGSPRKNDYLCFLVVIQRDGNRHRSEEHTSELQSRGHLVCRL